MSPLQAIILGIIQGLTEFLPISSSGHLVILPYFLKWDLNSTESYIFNILVQIGTLLAVIFYFRSDLLAIIKDFFKQIFAGQPFGTHNARLGWLLIIATIPAGIIGLLFEDAVEQAFSSPRFVGIALLITGILMVIAEIVNKKIGDIHDITLPVALLMGFMQSLAIFPGISRSGSTISGGMFSHVRRKEAGKFSFLMSIPIMLAAGALSTYKLFTEIREPEGFLPVLVLGFLTAAIVGYIAIRWLLKFLSEHSLIYFSIYCFLLGGITIIVSIL